MGKPSKDKLDRLQFISFGLLEGSSVLLGALVAPLIFRNVKSRDKAGAIFGRILRLWSYAALGWTVMLAIAGVVEMRRKPAARPLQISKSGASFAMVGMVVQFRRVLSRMDTIKQNMNLPIEEYPENEGPRLEFNQLHQRSTKLMKSNMGLGLVWLGFSLAGRLVGKKQG